MVKAIVEESAGMNPRIAEGIYVGRFAGAVEKTITYPATDKAGNLTGGDETADRWEWVFGVRTDPKDVSKDMRFTVQTSQKISSKSNAFIFMKALVGGKAPSFGSEFDTDDVIGNYALLTIKDKTPTKADKTGKITITSAITDMMPCSEKPAVEISTEGLIIEEEPEVEAPSAPAPAAPKKKK